MNLIGFKREPGGGFYLRLRGSCRLLSHSSAILQPQVPKATGQGISIRASAPYKNNMNNKDSASSKDSKSRNRGSREYIIHSVLSRQRCQAET
jgi:hypothetical protein